MRTKRTTRKKKPAVKQILWDRDIKSYIAARAVMLVIRCDAVKSAYRNSLVKAHFAMVYHYAHHENEQIDLSIKISQLVKPSGIAARIVERSAGSAIPVVLP